MQDRNGRDLNLKGFSFTSSHSWPGAAPATYRHGAPLKGKLWQYLTRYLMEAACYLLALSLLYA